MKFIQGGYVNKNVMNVINHYERKQKQREEKPSTRELSRRTERIEKCLVGYTQSVLLHK